jgi:biotin-(acetyl-CoA carboxylase) ligase
MLSIFSINMGNPFNELSTKLTKFDLHLADIECQRCLELPKAIAKELEKETKRVMENAGRAFLKRKQEASATITSPDLVAQHGKQVVHHSYPIEDPSRSTIDTPLL